MKTRRDRAFFVLCLLVQGALVVGIALAAHSGSAPSRIVTGLALSFIPYAGTLLFSRSISERSTLDRIALVMGFVFGAAWVFAPPVLSDDVYRYLWEGRVWLDGQSPYRLSPNDPVLTPLRDELWVHINNKSLASIYPPLSQLIFVVAVGLGGKLWTIKLLALLAQVSAVAVLARLSSSPKAALALALNPLLLSEAALNGHFDILCGIALLASAHAMARHRFAKACVSVCLAVGLKVVGLVLLPLFVRRPRALLAAAVGSALMLFPLLGSLTPGDPSSGTAQFAARWRGNESLFALADWLSRQLVDPLAAQRLARLLVAMVLLVICVVIVRRRVPATQAARAILWCVLLLSPQVHPWYLAWLLPLDLAAAGFAGMAWTALALLAYAPLDQWVAEGVWNMPLGLQILEYALLAAALIVDPRRASLRGEASEERFSM